MININFSIGKVIKLVYEKRTNGLSESIMIEIQCGSIISIIHKRMTEFMGVAPV